MNTKRICVFCGSSAGADPAFAAAAKAVGDVLACRGVELVYGGGNVGLMGIVADAAIKAGGRVTGVIPQSLVDRELAHKAISDLRIVSSMHERKAMMADLSDAFVALPGGYGTLEEFCEILTWAQLGLHQKPFGLLNVQQFYDSFIAQIDHAVRMKFIRPQHRDLLMTGDTIEGLLEQFAAFEPLPVHKWIGRDET
jgi:uncharacterized protein (TIGR00730 family)